MGENKNTNSAVTNEQILGLMDTVRKLYLADDIPWVVGYSGGKDSTATLQLVWLSIKDLPVEQRKKTIHIINTDTLVESPVVAKWAKNSLKKMDEIAQKIAKLNKSLNGTVQSSLANKLVSFKAY